MERGFEGGSGNDALDEQLEQHVEGVGDSKAAGGGDRDASFLEPKMAVEKCVRREEVCGMSNPAFCKAITGGTL